MKIYRYSTNISGHLVPVATLRGLLLPLILILLPITIQPAQAYSSLGKELPQGSPSATLPMASRAAQQPALHPMNGPGVLLSESFDDLTFPPANWGTTVVTGTDQSWSRVTSTGFPSASPHSGAGMAQFDSFFAFDGDSTRLYTPLLDFTGQTTPTFTFWFYHSTGDPGSDDRLFVEISTDGGNSYSALLPAIPRNNGSAGWVQYTLDLSAYIGQRNIRLGFLGISAFGHSILIDDVRVGPPLILNSIFLPSVVKSPVPSNSYSGEWTGTTSQGEDVFFDVGNNEITYLEFTARVSSNCKFEYFNNGLNQTFSGDTFSFSMQEDEVYAYTFSGTFASTTRASGTLRVTLPDCGTNSNITWNATKE